MKLKLEQINAALPQTQCTLCGYAGCHPYAEAMVYKQESIDKCLPGGVETLMQLGKRMQQDITPLIQGMQEKARPALQAIIEEEACIGCKKCLQVCPVDAILGASKQMHIVISAACTGCELCVPACPVDCIDMIEIPKPTPLEKMQQAQQAKVRYEFRQLRLQRSTRETAEKHRQLKFADINNQADQVLARKQEIKAAVARVKAQKNGR